MAKRLYTEDDVRRMSAGAELVLGPDALATPSALDLARERGIRVRFATDGADPAVSPPRSALAQHLGGDGEYHLVVRDGRLRAWRLGPEGPVEIPLDR